MDGFHRLTISIAHIHKTVQRIKSLHMNRIGMKGSYALCISCLINHPEGMTATALCEEADLNKAAVSRILKDLEAEEYIRYGEEGPTRHYRNRILLTEKGREMASYVRDRIVAAVAAGKNAITEEELAQFYRTLHKLTENLDTMCEELEKSL